MGDTRSPLRTTNTTSGSRSPLLGPFQLRPPAAALKEADRSLCVPPRASRRFPSFSDRFPASRGRPARRGAAIAEGGVATPPRPSLLSRGRPESPHIQPSPHREPGPPPSSRSRRVVRERGTEGPRDGGSGARACERACERASERASERAAGAKPEWKPEPEAEREPEPKKPELER
nr:balbiani ring protein 1-like [Peromyscus maniculatus bairdii]